MLYLVILKDIPDNREIRTRLLDAHMAYIGRFLSRIQLGGPLLADNHEDIAGGLLLVEAESVAEVRQLVAGDPYFQAGLWSEVDIRPFKEILNGWKTAPAR